MNPARSGPITPTFKALPFFIILVVISLCTSVNARQIDSQTFSTIRNTLNVNVSDTRLRNTLNGEITPGVLYGDKIILRINQLNYGLELHSSSYLSRYTNQFRLLQRPLNRWLVQPQRQGGSGER